MQRSVRLGVASLGITAFVTQVIALREFLTLFAGNELVIGVMLGNWMLLTGLGSFLGRRPGPAVSPVRKIILCQAASALLSPALLVAIRLVKQFFLQGIQPGIGAATIVSIALLAPCCLLSGFLLTRFGGLVADREGAAKIGHVFVLDTLGYVVGGLLFSFCLVHYFSPFQSLTFVMVLSLLSAVLLAMTAGRPALGVVVLAALIVALAAFWNIDVERLTARALYPGQELLHERSTPYGTLAVTRQETQINVYENGVPVGSTQDFVAAEETVHYALAQRPAAKHVLLVSGALTGAIREAAKYPLARIDQVELDPEVLAVVRKISAPEKDPRVVMISEDARRFLRRARGRYDAILMDMPDPSNAQINRYYTAEFFAEAKRALRPGGALSFRLSGSENYAGPEMRRLASSVYRSCASVFKHVLVIPGARRYFLASDEPLDYNIAARLEERRIETRYVHRSYLTAKLTEERIREAKESVSDTVDLNRDFYPTGVHAHLRYWLGHFGGGMAAPGLLVLVIGIGIAALVRASPDRPVSAAISATGFAGMGIEIVLIVAFQICYGYAYRQIGLIVTAFMIGSAAGAAWSARRAGDPRARLARLDGLLAVFAFVLAPALEALRAVDHPLIAAGGPPVIFPVLTGVTGFLGGAQFPLAAKATFQGAEKTFGRLYAVDLLGAAFGSIVISALLIPLIGIAGACYCLGGVKLASAVALRLRRGAPAESQAEVVRDTGAVAPFAVAGFVFAAIGLLIVLEETAAGVYAVSFVPAYHWALLALLAVGLIRAMEFDFGAAWRRSGMHPMRWIHFAAFSLAVFYPIFRCYFKIPYLFCHVCPRKCVFGFLRPWLVPAALIMNLEKRHWCYHACPIGTFYDCQARTGGKPARRPIVFRVTAIAVLIFTAAAYFMLKHDLAEPPAAADWYAFFYLNAFGVSAAVLATAAVLIVLAWRLRRAFCESLCPVGTFSDLMLKLDRAGRG